MDKVIFGRYVSFPNKHCQLRPFLHSKMQVKKGEGVALSEENEHGREHPILYTSRKFSACKEAYSTTEK